MSTVVAIAVFVVSPVSAIAGMLFLISRLRREDARSDDGAR